MFLLIFTFFRTEVLQNFQNVLERLSAFGKDNIFYARGKEKSNDKYHRGALPESVHPYVGFYQNCVRPVLLKRNAAVEIQPLVDPLTLLLDLNGGAPDQNFLRACVRISIIPIPLPFFSILP